MTERKSFDFNSLARRKQASAETSTSVHTGSVATQQRENTNTSSVATLPSKPVMRTGGLPDLPMQVKNEVVPVASTSASKKPATKNARSIAAIKRNSSPKDTERKVEILKYLSRTPIARAEHIRLAVSKFEYENPIHGGIAPATLQTIREVLSSMRKQGLVDYDNRFRGCTVWYITEEGAARLGMKPLVRKRRVQRPDGRWVKEAQLPATRHWQHTLGLAALQALFISEGYVFANDGLMEKALNERNADGTETFIAVPARDFIEDPMWGKADWDLVEEYAAYFPMPKGVGKSHRPDLVVLLPGGPTAVELELSRKNTAALTENIQAYIRAKREKRIEHVIYYGPENIISYAEHVVKECTRHTPELRPLFQFEMYDADVFNSRVPF